MHIFSINNKYDGYDGIKSLDLSQTDILDDKIGQRLEAEWSPISFEWEQEEDAKPDLFLYLGFILMVNRNTKELFLDKLKLNGVEYLPVSIEGEEYYVVNVCGFLSGAVDLDRSDVNYYTDGKLMWINDFAFHKGIDYPKLFRVPEIKTAIFATDDLVNLIQSNILNGLEFTLCAL